MSSSKSRLNELRIHRRPTPASSGRIWLILIVVAVVCAVGAGAWWISRPGAIEVHTAIAREASSEGTGSGGGAGERTILNASGYVTARREATVSSKITGKVIEVLVEEGMRVKEGQVLARLDETNATASLSLAQAQLDSTKAALAETRVRMKEADQELERQSGLMQRKVASQADYDHAEAASNALKAKLQQQQADIAVGERSVESWQQQWDDTIIRAPFAGVVTSKNAQPGEMISPMSSGGFTRTGICTIVDMDSLEIEIDVNESYINRVEPGQPVEATLDAYPEWKIPCKVIAIIPTADRQKSTVKVRVGFDKLDPRILPEMSVKVAFREVAATPRDRGSKSTDTASTSESRTGSRAVIVPKAALSEEESRDIVFVVHDNRAERRAVSVSSRTPEEITLSAGVAPNERVVLDRPPNLADGSPVKEITQ